MGRNIVVCCDGTGNKFAKNNTNVVRLVESIDRTDQLFYYDPGVGTLPLPGLSNPVKWLKWSLWTVADLMVGSNLETNVQEAYAYLMEVWEPGDRVFLFGFSRGAYSVRVLAGLLHALGLLRRDQVNLIQYLMAIYKSIDAGCFTCKGKKDEFWKRCAQFRRTFARDTPRGKHFPIHFIGLWDTVSSYGWVWNPRIYTYTASLPNVAVIRHALSIDEHRAFFRQNLLTEDPDRDIKQYWFPGVHADVGGGYAEKDGGLWREPFEWLIAESAGAGLLFDPAMLNHVRNRTLPPDKPWLEYKHSSLLWKPWWWIAEFFPKLHPYKSSVRVNLFRPRTVHEKAKIHESAIKRLQDSTNYRPSNLSSRFVLSVMELQPVPHAVEYHA